MFQRPDLNTLIDRIQSDMESRLPGADAGLRRTVLAVLARTMAGAVHGLYGLLSWLAQQILPDTAEAEYLDRHAGVWGIARKAAVAASGSVTFTGTDGLQLPAGTVLQRGDGVEYSTDALGTVSGGSVTVACTAIEGGSGGNAPSGTALSVTTPVAGISASGSVTAPGLAGGTDTESDDGLRARVLARIQQPPQGGAAHDYEQWALAVADVTRVWVFPNEVGIGTVVVRFVVDDDPGGPIPDAAQLQAVADYIDPLRPVTAHVYVSPPVATPLDLTIALTPNDATTQAAVTAELQDLLLREGEPGSTLLLSHIREAISIAAGETNHVLVSPAADVAHNIDELPVLGTITWQ